MCRWVRIGLIALLVFCATSRNSAASFAPAALIIAVASTAALEPHSSTIFLLPAASTASAAAFNAAASTMAGRLFWTTGTENEGKKGISFHDHIRPHAAHPETQKSVLPRKPGNAPFELTGK